MKPKLLIITKNPDNYQSIIASNYSKNKIIWLQLWPVFNTEEILKQFPKVKLFKSIDFTNNEDHYEIADCVTNISQNWWNLLGLDKENGEEWNIEGLKISQIFAYEIEQILTNLMFQILAINRAYERFKPSKIFFINNLDTKRSTFDFPEIGLMQFYENKFVKVSVSKIIIDGFINKHSKRHLFIDKIQKNTIKNIFKKIGYRLIKPKLKMGSIIISNSNRCLHKFEEIASVNRQIFILDNKQYTENHNKKYIFSNNTKDIYFDGISLTPFLVLMKSTIEKKYNNLINFYKTQNDLIANYKPQMYITVNMASSEELVKLWAYEQNGVRMVYAAEGLGIPDKKIMPALNSVFHPEIAIERWVVSDFFAKTFSKNNKSVKITGYLERGINSIKKERSKKNNTIVFALSTVNPNVRRAILGEDIFEMLKSVNDVAKVITSHYSTYKLIIRLHPGDRNKVNLFKSYLKEYNNVEISINDNLNTIIEASALVIIYDTSVGFESLVKNKNVICYNYTKRPSYITAIYNYVNHNPEKGAALMMVYNKEDLKETIKKLLPYANNTKPSPNLEYLLENAREGYDVKKIVKELISAV